MKNSKKEQAIIIGVQKSGTTSVYNWLSQHPDIFAPDFVKDFPFFADDRMYSHGLSYYQHLFKEYRNQKVVLAGSVHYIFFPKALKRIYQMDKKTKLLVFLRHPVKRAYSAYCYAVERDLEKRTFEEAIEEEMKAKDQQKIYKTLLDRFQKYYLARGLYYKQLKKLFEIFSKDQVYVGFFEDIVNNPQKLTKDIFKFLEIDQSVSVDYAKKNVTKGGSRSKLLNAILFNPKIRNLAFFQKLKYHYPQLFQKTKYAIRGSIINLNRKKVEVPPLSAETYNLLGQFYQDDVTNLKELLKTDPGWSLKMLESR